MYNPEKQARASGGRFGGKVVEAVEELTQAVEEVVHEQTLPPWATAAAAPLDYAADVLDTNNDGEITFDDVRKGSVASLFALAAGVAIVAGLLVRCAGI